MKNTIQLLHLFIAVMLTFTACGDDENSTPEDPGTVLYTTLPNIIGGNTLGGFLSEIDSGAFTTYGGYEDCNTVITSPMAAHIRVDGFVKVEGTKSGSNTVYLSIIKDNTIEYMEELPKGNFSRYLYFREAATDYHIALLNPNKASYSYLAIINVTNEPTADIQFLVPTMRIQAFDPEIRVLANGIIDSLSTPSDETIAKAFHDYIALLIYYDFDSLTDRKDQDALAVLDNGMAVCEGYATLYAALLRASGIRAQVYTGSNHAWNMVYWDSSWHDVDVTWDDPVMSVGGTCDTSTGENCSSDFPNGENLRYTYFDTGFTGDPDHDGTVNLFYKK